MQKYVTFISINQSHYMAKILSELVESTVSANPFQIQVLKAPKITGWAVLEVDVLMKAFHKADDRRTIKLADLGEIRTKFYC